MCTQETTRRDDAVEAGQGDAPHATDAAGRCRQIERLDDFDDLYQAGLSDDQLCGRMAAFADHFDIEADCSEIERRVIEDLKAYLRPSKAPESLVRRCHQCLASDEGASDDGTGGSADQMGADSGNQTAAHDTGDRLSGGKGTEIPIR